MSVLQLGLEGLVYHDLFRLEGLKKLDQAFLDRLSQENPQLRDDLLAYREGRREFSLLETSELLIACGPILENFIGELFRIDDELERLQAEILSHNPVFVFKKLFVLRRARRRLLKNDVEESFAALDTWVDKALKNAGLSETDRELAIAKLGRQFLNDTETHKDDIEMLTRWCIRALTMPEGQTKVKGWASFRLPRGVDHAALVPTEPVKDDRLHRIQGPINRQRLRDGFKLTDPRMTQRQVQAEVDYCIYCHDHDGDFCSRGFPEKKGEPDKGFKVNPLDVELIGCPLGEKISEMHTLKKNGHALAALAMITVDNPLCPVTGHRICNDCMNACIYQKQDAVDIPQIETRVLTDVLSLPWGVEIYGLLTRWNPLRRQQWLPKPYNSLKILIAGMGPAGFTLAHYLTMEGFAVVGIDGLKIEPLPAGLIDNPIRNYEDLEEELDSRIMAGFGGVAEYGITVRWDKNFLKLIYLTLLRRPRFQVFGGVRFGGALTVEEAWKLDFDHIAIAVGSGLPKTLTIPGSLAPGMRMAADFLMTLQLTGAAKQTSLANLQMRLPTVVIGGGLTGIDTATEAQAYYITQVEKILDRYDKLAETLGEAGIRRGLDEASLAILDEYLEHGKAVRTERATEAPDLQRLVQQWGGVTVVYRRQLRDSPAYIHNHEEVIKALEEGIYYAEGLSPKAAKLDRHGHLEALRCERMELNKAGGSKPTSIEVEIPARTVLIATGAKPNIGYYFEHPGTFDIEGPGYQTNIYRNGKLESKATAKNVKDPDFGVFTSYDNNGRHVSVIGDTHPVFNGNVVKAVASGLRIYPKIVEAFDERINAAGDENEYHVFRDRIQDLLQAKVLMVKRHTPGIIELQIRAPMAARRFQPGEIFRLQNYETLAPVVEGTRLQTEAIALTGSRVDSEAGTVSLIVRECGASTRLCATLKTGDPVALMGPSGNRSKIPEDKTILFIGDWLAAASLRSLGPAYKKAGNKVLFMVTFPNSGEVFCRDDLEAVSDVIVWVTQEGDPIPTRRNQDISITGELVEVLERYAKGELTDGTPPIRLEEVDHLHITADNRLLREIQNARRQELKDHFTKQPATTGSIYSSMQCMLKGVCAQCLQWQIDPKTGQRTKAVFACSWQDEPLDIVDLDALGERLSQNRLQEHLANLWLDYLFARNEIERI